MLPYIEKKYKIKKSNKNKIKIAKQIGRGRAITSKLD